MAVPITAVDKDDGIVFLQADVRTAGKPRTMKAKSKTQPVKTTSQQKFRLGILALDPGHHLGPLRPIHDINHSEPLHVRGNLG